MDTSCTSCFVKCFRSRSSFISSRLWTPSVYGPTSPVQQRFSLGQSQVSSFGGGRRLIPHVSSTNSSMCEVNPTQADLGWPMHVRHSPPAPGRCGSPHVWGWMVRAHPSLRTAANIPILDTLRQNELGVTKDRGWGAVRQESVQ